MKKFEAKKKLVLEKQKIRELGRQQVASAPVVGGMMPGTLGCWFSKGSNQGACCA
jgi:hypothetical protein